MMKTDTVQMLGKCMEKYAFKGIGFKKSGIPTEW
jgi:hypothetical protein